SRPAQGPGCRVCPSIPASSRDRMGADPLPMDFSDLSPAGWTFVLLVSVLLPFASIRSAGQVRVPGGGHSRPRYLASFFTIQGIGLATALSAARYEEVGLFPAPSLGTKNVWIAVAFLVPAVGTLPMRWSW